MAITNSVDDYEEGNDAGTAANWTASGYDTPTLNDSAATTPIYLENTTCMFWPLKKGVTNGYTYTGTLPANWNISGKVLVGFIQYPFADIDAIPITQLQMRVSSDTTPTANYRQFDALAQLTAPENTPISGFTPVMGYSSGGTTSGTPNMSDIESFAWVATTGNNADGKQGGFDHLFAVSYLGAHSQTFTDTFLSDLYDEWYDNNGGGLPGTDGRPLGVLSQASDFFQTNVRFALGDGTSDTANIVVTETNKTIFFNNLESDHELGWRLTNPSGANQLQLTLTGCTMIWNDQDATTEIYDGVENADIFRIDSCSHTNGGRTVLAAGLSAANGYVKNSSFSGCRRIEASSMTFENNSIADHVEEGVRIDATSISPVSDATANMKNLQFTAPTTGDQHAIVIVTPGEYTFDNFTFSGYTESPEGGAAVYNNSGGAVTINIVGGGDIPSVRNGASATTTVNADTQVTITNLQPNTEVRVYPAEDFNSPLDTSEIAGVENTGSPSEFTFSAAAGTIVDIVILHVDYILPPNNRITNYVVPSSDTTFPVTQVIDRNKI